MLLAHKTKQSSSINQDSVSAAMISMYDILVMWSLWESTVPSCDKGGVLDAFAKPKLDVWGVRKSAGRRSEIYDAAAMIIMRAWSWPLAPVY